MDNKSHKISDEAVNIVNIKPQKKVLVFDRPEYCEKQKALL